MINFSKSIWTLAFLELLSVQVLLLQSQPTFKLTQVLTNQLLWSQTALWPPRPLSFFIYDKVTFLLHSISLPFPASWSPSTHRMPPVWLKREGRFDGGQICQSNTWVSTAWRNVLTENPKPSSFTLGQKTLKLTSSQTRLITKIHQTYSSNPINHIRGD